MPGIVGVFSSDRLSSESEQSFPAMCESLRHTARQKLSGYRYKSLLLGRVDLGIIQINIDQRETEYVIAFIWGELVNPQCERKELLKGTCDTRKNIDDLDFLIGLFSKSKYECATYLRGSFNAFIVDKQRRALTIVSDRFGFRPLYYYSSGNELIFSSEVKAILKHRGIKKVVNPAGIADFFHYGFVTGDKTFFNGIEMFPPGGIAFFEKKQLRIKKYWNLIFTENESAACRKESDYIDELAGAIKDSVKANTVGGFRFGLPLSGGLDSRAIAACIPSDTYPVLIYTWGMPNSREVQIAKKIAESLGLEHHNLRRTPEEFVDNFEKSVIMTDGMISGNLPLGNFLYEGSFAPYVDICLDGMQSICVVHPIRPRPLNKANILEQLTVKLSAESLKTILADSCYHRFNELAAESGEEFKESITALHPINGYQLLDITQKQRRLDNFGVVVKRNFVEVRSPLFDYPVMDVVQRIPPALRKQRYVYYKAFAHISPELAKIRNVVTTVPISSPHWLQLAGRVTKGLKSKVYSTFYEKVGINYDRHKLSDWGIDFGCWYNESEAIKRFMKEVLSSENIRHCEHLNPKGVDQILEAQSTGTKIYTETINRLLTYAIWSKNFS
jgi:asparagine synthase (glutamine-hydrolysing)